jgi:two-component system OmpR family sensor kinase
MTSAMMRTMTAETTTETGMGDRRPSPSGLSVRVRITAAVAALVAMALGAAGLLVYALGLDGVEERVPAAVEQEMAELQELYTVGTDPTTGEDFTSIRRLLEVFLQRNVPSRSELMVGVWRDDIRVSSASTRSELRDDPEFRDAVLTRVRTGGTVRLDSEWGEVYLEVLPLRDSTSAGAFAVAYFVQDELAPLDRVIRTYAGAAVIALGLVTAVAAWQAGRLLARVRTLRETAEEISGTDLTRRIPEFGNDDLTDLTRTFNAMLDRLQQAFRGQRAFLDDAGHELRTPLTILSGHLELLDPGDPEDVTRTRALLLDETERMARLVEDMILLTKADRPGFLTVERVLVDELVDAVADKVRGLGDRDWSVDGRAGGEMAVDQQRITQALVQLAHNAVKHTSSGDAVAIGSLDGPEDTVLLWVRDTGPGVLESQRLAIFDRFTRGPVASADDGAGLGLSIVAAIVRAHGGSVHVEDAAPHGARFVISLPRTRKDPSWHAS